MRLRKLEPEDVVFLYQWENDANAWPDGAVHNPVSQQDLRDYIASTTGDIFRDGQLRLMMDVDGCTVGCIDLFDLDVRNRKAAIGMYIAPEHRGKGYGQQAVAQLEELSFRHLGLDMIYAIIGEKNEACNKLYSRMKFENTARLLRWTVEGDALLWQKIREI